MIRASTLLLLLAVGLTSCGSTSSQTSQSVDLGAEVTLAPGASAMFKPDGVEVRFVAVTEDSRCPRDATCVWAGQVKVQLSIHSESQPPAQHEIVGGESAVVGDYKVTVVKVLPETSSSSKILPGDYRVTVTVQGT